MKVYLAGKITDSDWRQELLTEKLSLSADPFPHIDENSYVNAWDAFGSPKLESPMAEPRYRWPILKRVVVGGFDYVGPYFTTFPQNGREPDTHGNDFCAFNNIQEYGWEHGGDDLPGQEMVVQLCLDAIHRADVVFAWLDGADLYGTLVEIGYARGIGKPVWIGTKDYETYRSGEELNRELWFAETIASHTWHFSDSPLEAWERCLKHYQPSLLKHIPYREYLKTAHWEETRKKALDRARHRCQACNTQDDLHVHHRTYERRGEERDDDLTVLCRSCHSRIHGLVNGRVTRMPVKA